MRQLNIAITNLTDAYFAKTKLLQSYTSKELMKWHRNRHIGQ